MLEHEETLSPVASRDYTRLSNERDALLEENRKMRRALHHIKCLTDDNKVFNLNEGNVEVRVFLLAHHALQDMPDRRSWRDRLAAWWQTRRARRAQTQ